ncbi:hypothetical protein MMC13_001247 [Lambiella insularis]|nr:hypothetical protein [Lambiella insularis]
MASLYPVSSYSAMQLILLLLGAFCASLVFIIVRRAYFHPLSKFPGPFFGKFTPYYTFSAVFQQNRTMMQHELLQKYGSPVRVSTNELIFSDMQSFPDIYGQSSNPCLKDGSVYDIFTVTGATNVLIEKNRVAHARLRRLLSHVFSVKGVLQSESLIAFKVQQYIDVVFKGHEGETIDIHDRTSQLYLDVVSHLSFGESYDTLVGKNPTALRDLGGFFTIIPPTSFFPWLRYLPSAYIREGFRGLKRLEDFSRTHVTDYLRRTRGEKRLAPSSTWLQNLIKAEDSESGTSLSEEELVENSILLLAAGTGTTAATLMHFVWECGRRPEIRAKLVQEIRETFPDPKLMPSYEEAAKLNYLRCVLDEVLRLWGPLSVSATRISPGRNINGIYIPKGAVISTNPFSTARDPKYFPDPLFFDPSRWESATPDMRNMSRPFSYGPRNCIGKHLAEISLLLTITRLYQLYDVVTHPSMTQETMEQIDKGVLEPRSTRVLVIPTAAVK